MNIVFAFADDWGRYASCYSNPINDLINTPAIDRIANEGILFRNAIVPAPSCTPCRSSLLSGKYFWQTQRGAILTGARWDTSIPTFPLELEKNGYHIGYTYKVWAPGENKNAPYGGERNEYMHAGKRFWNYSQEVTKRAAEIGIPAAKEELLNEVRQNFQDFLDKRKENQPFCYWWGPTNTHRKWEHGSGKNLWGLEPDDLKGKLPASVPDVPEVREDFCDYLGEALAFDSGVGVLIEMLETIGELNRTLFVVSGDHGIPGMPRGKCNLYNLGCEVALVMRWPGTIQPGRVVEDFVNLMDLAPTFLDAMEVEIPDTMVGRSLLPIMKSVANGQIEEKRDFVVTGRERHVDAARDGFLPYPQRAIRTEDFLYVYNFCPDRWPMGDPGGLENPDFVIPHEVLVQDTMVAYPDMDASPTKAWMIEHRNEVDYRDLYDLGFGKRPMEELFDLKKDKDAVNNVANLSEYQTIKRELHDKLFQLLKEQKDPRVCEENCCFESYPYTIVVNVSRNNVKKPDGWEVQKL